MEKITIREVLIYFYMKYDGDFLKMLKALERKEKVGSDFNELYEASKKLNLCTVVDDDYPTALKSMMNPPIVFDWNRPVMDTYRSIIESQLS